MSFEKTDETRVAKTAVAIDYNHTLSFFNNRAGKYLERNPYAVTMYQDDNPDLVRERNAAEVERLIPFLKLDDSSKVLDLACGVGRWADAVRGKALSYTGIDFSSELIKIARCRCGADSGCRFFTGSVIDFKRILEHNQAGKYDRFLLIGILMYINDGDLYRVLNDIAECSDERAVVCIREPVGTKERLTLRDFYSRELQSAYNAIYRTKESIDEFLEQTLIKKGFTITHSDFLFENSKLNNRKETEQYFWILTRGDGVMYKETIGVVGGFGGYATLSFFQRLLKEFSMGCERDIPHIYMDNDFSMPSRTRALLTGECYDEVVMKIAKSLKGLCISGGADYIVLPCGTAHAFLPDVYRIVPEAEEKVLHIVKLLGNTLEEAGVEETLILAAEGLLKKKLYPRWLSKIKCVNPSEEYYTDIRFFIECVKQDKMDKNCLKKFVDFLSGFGQKNVVLGCTEFPVLVGTIKKSELAKELDDYVFHDPLEIVLKQLKKLLK